MLAHCIILDTEEDLMKQTGLNHKELWSNGFNLDDWDICFCSDKELDDEFWWLQCRMESYCCGYEVTEYNNVNYYMVYHA